MSSKKPDLFPKNTHYESYESGVKKNHLLKVQIEDTNKYVYMFSDQFIFLRKSNLLTYRRIVHKKMDRVIHILLWHYKGDFFASMQVLNIYGEVRTLDEYAVYRSREEGFNRTNRMLEKILSSSLNWSEIFEWDEGIDRHLQSLIS